MKEKACPRERGHPISWRIRDCLVAPPRVGKYHADPLARLAVLAFATTVNIGVLHLQRFVAVGSVVVMSLFSSNGRNMTRRLQRAASRGENIGLLNKHAINPTHFDGAGFHQLGIQRRAHLGQH